jgi:hypothetical protein
MAGRSCGCAKIARAQGNEGIVHHHSGRVPLRRNCRRPDAADRARERGFSRRACPDGGLPEHPQQLHHTDPSLPLGRLPDLG